MSEQNLLSHPDSPPPPLLPGAWIMTGGSHAGVMRYVGQAVRDQALSSKSTQDQMVAIGMASWGAVHNRQALVQEVGGTRGTRGNYQGFLSV